MDVLRVDPDTYLPDILIEDYTSMVWTERFAENGEFQLKTAKVAETRALIPEDSLITLRDSKEVMFVETHEIGVDDEGAEELTVTGRTFETFLENRAMTGVTYRTAWETLKSYYEGEILALLMWNHLVNATGQDPTQAGRAQDALTAIDNLVVTDSSDSSITHTWWLESGQVYPAFKDLLTLTGKGVRAVRPSGFDAYVATFDTSGGGSRGNVSWALTSNILDLALDIYDGLDRTRYQSDREPVIFHYQSGHIENPKYLFSIKELKDMAIVNSSIGQTEIWPVGAVETVSGLSRRVLFVDGGDQGDMLLADFQASLEQKGAIELGKYNRKAIFDGAIPPISPYKYGSEYALGDMVTVLANYNFELSMRVAEYVRTEDQAGDRGYPTLVLSS